MSESTPEATEPEATAAPEGSPATLPDDHPLVRTLAEQKKAIRELKGKAQRLDEIEEANKSDLEKANGRITTAESERDMARAEALRLRTAVKHGISLEDADLFLTGTDEDTLTAQAKRLTDRESERKRQGNHVPREGSNPSSAGDQVDAQFARKLFSTAE